MPLNKTEKKAIINLINSLGTLKAKRKAMKTVRRSRLMTAGQKKALIKAIGKNKSMKPSSRKSAIRKIKAKKTRKG